MAEIDSGSCCICNGMPANPRILPCLHAFCAVCLREAVPEVEKRKSTDKLPCPVCRTGSAIPPPVTEGPQKNFLMGRRKNGTLTSKSIRPQLGEPCDICMESMEDEEDEESVQPAEYYCIQCDKNICKRCCKSHKSIAALRGHQLTQLGAEVPAYAPRTTVTFPQYGKESAKRFCRDCKQTVSEATFAQYHQNHACANGLKVGASGRQELKAAVGKTDSGINEWQTRGRQRVEEHAAYKQNADCVDNGINSRAVIQHVGKLNIPFTSVVHGLSKLENKFFVLCYCPITIYVFDDQAPYRRHQNIEINMIKTPRDIVSLEKSRCMYVTDSGEQCIWKIAISDRRITKWLAGVGDGPFSMSVTSKGNLMVLRGNHHINHIEHYGPDTEILRRLPLPKNVTWPVHVVQKANEEYVITHSMTSYTKGPWIISRLSSDANQVLAQFNLTDKLQELNGTRRLALDPDNDLLFFADYGKNRVIAFDGDSLSEMKTLLTKDENGISRPCRLLYDSKRKRLLVGQDEGNVDIYQIS